MEPFVLPAELVAEMCVRLEVDLPADEAGVVALLDRWKHVVPFDPIAKALAMKEGRPPPGADPIEFCERWLGTGVGGTCWGHVAGLAGLLGAAGVPVRVAVDRMLVDRIDFHAFLVADVGAGRHVVLDPIHATTEPLLLEAGASGRHGPYRAGFTADEDRLLHWFVNPNRADLSTSYVVLATGLDAADVRAFCDISARFSGVMAGRLFTRRFPPGVLEQGGVADDGSYVLTTWTDDGPIERRLTDVAELQEALGCNDAGIAMAERAGLLRVVGSRLELLRRDDRIGDAAS